MHEKAFFLKCWFTDTALQYFIYTSPPIYAFKNGGISKIWVAKYFKIEYPQFNFETDISTQTMFSLIQNGLILLFTSVSSSKLNYNIIKTIHFKYETAALKPK